MTTADRVLGGLLGEAVGHALDDTLELARMSAASGREGKPALN